MLVLALSITMHVLVLRYLHLILIEPKHTTADSWIEPLKASPQFLVSGDSLSLNTTKNQPISSRIDVASASMTKGQYLGPTSLSTNGADGRNPQHYRTTSELDTRAAPVRDWNIAREALPPNTVTSLVFTVWVSADGIIDHYVLENDDQQPSWAAQALSHLQDTLMEPGTFNDQAVPSTMTVELLIDNTL